jgi:ADP-ribosylglycohydrolase
MSTQPLPHDHAARLDRARLALDGLSVGDAFCSQFFMAPVWERHFHARSTPPGPWRWTDDTAMALSIVEVLACYGRIEQYDLAEAFAHRYDEDWSRGYGPAAHQILSAIHQGTPWRNVSHAAFGGQGSMGNGAAMRVAPVGAYFADDFSEAVRQADASAEVTHAHPEGRAGAIAVAVAAAWAWNHQGRQPAGAGGALLRAALEHTPPGQTRDGVQRALEVPADTRAERAGRILGNGSRVTAPDTVPFTLWCADRYLGDYPGGLWAAIEAGGDVDTTGAIIGGVVALAAPTTIPPAWREARESLD